MSCKIFFPPGEWKLLVTLVALEKFSLMHTDFVLFYCYFGRCFVITLVAFKSISIMYEKYMTPQIGLSCKALITLATHVHLVKISNWICLDLKLDLFGPQIGFVCKALITLPTHIHLVKISCTCGLWSWIVPLLDALYFHWSHFFHFNLRLVGIAHCLLVSDYVCTFYKKIFQQKSESTKM